VSRQCPSLPAGQVRVPDPALRFRVFLSVSPQPYLPRVRLPLLGAHTAQKPRRRARKHPAHLQPGAWVASVFENRADVRYFISRLAREHRRGRLFVHAYVELQRPRRTWAHRRLRCRVGPASDRSRSIRHATRSDSGLTRASSLVLGRAIPQADRCGRRIGSCCPVWRPGRVRLREAGAHAISGPDRLASGVRSPPPPRTAGVPGYAGRASLPQSRSPPALFPR